MFGVDVVKVKMFKGMTFVMGMFNMIVFRVDII